MKSNQLLSVEVTAPISCGEPVIATSTPVLKPLPPEPSELKKRKRNSLTSPLKKPLVAASAASPKEQHDAHMPRGNFTSYRNDSYLMRTEDVEECASEFLTAFLSVRRYCESLQIQLEFATPAITFATIQCGDRKLCLVAASGRGLAATERKFHENLCEFVANYPNAANGYHFDLIINRNVNFDHSVHTTTLFLKQTPADKTIRGCGEKKLSAMIQKLSHHYHDDLFLDGMLSCSLVRPFYDRPQRETPPLKINLDGAPAWIDCIKPCEHCSRNKPAIYELWKRAYNDTFAPASPLEVHSLELSKEIDKFRIKR